MGVLQTTRRWLGLSTRSYVAATPQRTRFNGGANRYHSYSTEVAAARSTVQARSRQAVENQPIARAIIDTWENATIGAGMYPTSQHPDDVTRKAIDAYFVAWTKRADLIERTDFYGLQAACVRAERTDGEAFFRWVGDQLQAIPAEQVAMDLTTNLADGRVIINGIEMDDYGRPIALHIHPARPTDIFATYAPPVRVPMEECMHIFKPAGPGAHRGVSILAPVLLRLNELDGLEDALQVNAKMSALLAIIMTNESDMGDGTDPISDKEGLSPGEILKVPGSWKVHSTAPQQAQQVAEFLTHVTRSIASGAGVPHFAATGDVSQANYSSLRASLVTFRQKIEQYQFHVLVPQLLNPVWRRVITIGMLSGEIEAELNDDLFAVEWIAPAQPGVDPVKDLQAQVLALDNGLMSRKQAVAAQGYSLEQVDSEISADSFERKPAPKNPKDKEDE